MRISYVEIYNEETDTWSRISFKDAVSNVRADCLVTTNGKKAHYMWQLGDEFFSWETLRRVGLTMLRAAEREGGPVQAQSNLRETLHSMRLGDSLYLQHPESRASSSVPMFQLRRASSAGIDVASVERSLSAVGTSSNLVQDVLGRLSNVGDKQRFLSGIRIPLLSILG